jgi:hypothetical protein
LEGEKDFVDFAQALTEKMADSHNGTPTGKCVQALFILFTVAIHKRLKPMNKEILKGDLHAYQKYYYKENGKLARRNDSPRRIPIKVKFGNPKIDFQEGPLEDYLFSGVYNKTQFSDSIEVDRNESVDTNDSAPDSFIKALQKIELSHNHSTSTEREEAIFEEKY